MRNAHQPSPKTRQRFSSSEDHDSSVMVTRRSAYVLHGGWRQDISDKEQENESKDSDCVRYKDCSPLVYNIIKHAESRLRFLEKDGSKQIRYLKSNDGWMKTLFVIEGRAIGRIIVPWMICSLHAVLWFLIFEFGGFKDSDRQQGEDAEEPDDNSTTTSSLETWEFFIGIVLNTSLSFLLVFRLNRAAQRFWFSRQNWGVIVGSGCYLVSGILIHGRHDPSKRDDAIRWTAAYAIATMHFMRSIRTIPPESLAGILEPEQVYRMQQALHPPLYAADACRWALKELFIVEETTPAAIAHARTQHLAQAEAHLNLIMDQEGAMERIKSTPLPLVYVTHLRTFLFAFLLSLPYIWGKAWGGWATVPIVIGASFALLGLEGASAEVEAPFDKDRPNHLNMDAFCLLLLNTIQQSITFDADQELEKKHKGLVRERQHKVASIQKMEVSLSESEDGHLKKDGSAMEA